MRNYSQKRKNHVTPIAHHLGDTARRLKTSRERQQGFVEKCGLAGPGQERVNAPQPHVRWPRTAAAPPQSPLTARRSPRPSSDGPRPALAAAAAGLDTAKGSGRPPPGPNTSRALQIPRARPPRSLRSNLSRPAQSPFRPVCHPERLPQRRRGRARPPRPPAPTQSPQTAAVARRS